MTDIKDPEYMHLYNLPQNVKGGIPIHGVKDDRGNIIVVRFDQLDGMSSHCWVDGTTEITQLKADTPIMYDYATDQYSVVEE